MCSACSPWSASRWCCPGSSRWCSPYLGYKLLPENLQQHEAHDVYDKPFYRRFRRVVEWCLERRKTVIALTLAAFVLSLLAFKLLVAQQFFPPPTARN